MDIFIGLLGKYFPSVYFSGDEIFTVNGQSVAGLTHAQAINMFKETKVGSIQVTLGRREPKKTVGKEKKSEE